MNKQNILLCYLAVLCIVACKTEQPKLIRSNVKLYPIVLNEKWGYIDRSGKIIIEPQFDYAYKFSEGLGRIRIGDDKTGKYGFIDSTGKFVINPQFDDAGEFSEGLACARIGSKETGAYGFINYKGQYEIIPSYNNVSDFLDGYAIVRINNKYYFINRKGKIVFPERRYIRKRISKEVISTIIEQGYNDSRFFSEGLAAVKIDKKWGYINKKGKIVIAPQFDEAYDFSEGLAVVIISKKFGYINRDGHFVINPYWQSNVRFLTAEEHIIVSDNKSLREKLFLPINNSSFSEGFSVVSVLNGASRQYGYIDKTGNYIIKPQFSQAHNFSEGLAAVGINGKWGYIDKTGQFAINPIFDYAYGFSDGLAQVMNIGKSSDKPKYFRSDKDIIVEPRTSLLNMYGYINKNGKYVWEPTK